MKALGQVELKTVELPNTLEFTALSEAGWATSILWLVTMPFVLWLFWKASGSVGHWVAVIVCLISVIPAVASWLQGRESKLSVTAEEFVAEGNLAKLFSSKIRIPASEVESIGFVEGGDGTLGGFYVMHKWNHTCVLPGISEGQGFDVTEAILDKFPDIAQKYSGPSSPLYGADSGLTTLGLSDTDQQENDPQD